MLLVTLRDLQWRSRRIALGFAATALVLAMATLLAALHDAFLDETDRTVATFGADAWVVPDAGSGPFTSNTPMPAELTAQVAGEPGVRDASPVAIFRHTVTGAGPGFTDVNVIAYPPGEVVAPHFVAGRAPGPHEAAVDESLGVGLGTRLALAGHDLTVVGLVDGLTYNGGTPTVLLTLGTGQQVAYAGEPLASAIVTRGVPQALPAGLTVMTPTQVRDDLRRPLSVATGALALIAALLWVVAAGIVGMLAYLSGLDRTRELAVYKAFGVGSRTLLAGLVLEGAAVAFAAGVLAVVVAVVLAPAFTVPVSIDAGQGVRLVLVAVVVGALASMVSVLRAVRVDPVQAFAAG